MVSEDRINTGMTEVGGNDNTTDNVSDNNIEDVTDNQIFQTRVFLEKNKQVYGAEIVLFDNNKNPIDTILITDATDFDEMFNIISNMQKAYVSFTPEDKYILQVISEVASGKRSSTDEEYLKIKDNWSELQQIGDLETILKNTNTNVEINATTLNGYNSGQFSKQGHTHDEYLSYKHKDVVSVNGQLGHVKLVDNLETTNIDGGEVLSAKQGHELKNLIDGYSNKNKWSKVQTIEPHVKYRVNEDLRLVVLNFHWDAYTGLSKDTGDHTILKEGKIPAEYRPSTRVTTPTYRGDVVVRVHPNGGMYIFNLTQIKDINIHVQLMWHY